MSTANSRRYPFFTQAGGFAWRLAFAVLAVGPIGCSNRAHRDLYAQRMMSESRVLEDQLYQADYENRVLRDQLERYQREIAAAQIPTPSTIRPHDHPSTLNRSSRPAPAPVPDSEADSPSFDLGEGLDADEYEMPMFDDGVPMEDAAPKQSPQTLPAPKPEARIPEEDALDDDVLNDDVLNDDEGPHLLPAPGGPVPPGTNDTIIPPIEPGEVLPPPRDGREEVPPGQIILPEALQAAQGVPDQLQIHPTLSTAHHTDGELDGAVIVVNAVDATGRPVDIDGFNIEAELSIVVLDPSRPKEDAMIGRWDFNKSQIRAFVRDRPISGLHVPIQWQSESPDGDDVIVHVRLRGEDSDMRCESELRLAAKPSISDWTPRAETLR